MVSLSLKLLPPILSGPKKPPQKPTPIRHGVVYIAKRVDGAFLLETRPDSGLLGGMLGWPGSNWFDLSVPLPETTPPCDADWQRIDTTVRHTFTHFHLELQVWIAVITRETPVTRGALYGPTEFKPTDLPTVMRKAFELARAALT